MMTSLEAQGLLYQYFQKNETFELDSDFKKAVLLTQDEERDKAALQIALYELSKLGIVNPAPSQTKTIWVLLRPFSSLVQNVPIRSELALEIAEIINEFCRNVGDSANICSPAAIGEREIANLLGIIDALSTPEKEEETNT